MHVFDQHQSHTSHHRAAIIYFSVMGKIVNCCKNIFFCFCGIIFCITTHLSVIYLLNSKDIICGFYDNELRVVFY